MDKEGPLERITRYGVRSVSAIDLLAVALSRLPGDAVANEGPARALLAVRSPISEIADLSLTELEKAAGYTGFEATKFMATLELGRKAGLAGKGDPKCITGPAEVYELLEHLKHEKKEHFCAVFMNSKNGILCWRTIHIGTVNMSVVGPREVYREAIREGASSLIVAHNHPSGDPTPSPEDIEVTKKLSEIGELLDISLLDHIIIGHHGYKSLKELKFL